MSSYKKYKITHILIDILLGSDASFNNNWNSLLHQKTSMDGIEVKKARI